MFPPSQTVFVFNQWSFLFLETKFSKTWTFPRGQKKERTALVFRQSSFSSKTWTFPMKPKLRTTFWVFSPFIPLSSMVARKTLKPAPAQEQSQNRNSHPTNSSLFQDKTFSHLSQQSDQLHHVIPKQVTLDQPARSPSKAGEFVLPCTSI